jgi:hypothetical protein
MTGAWSDEVLVPGQNNKRGWTMWWCRPCHVGGATIESKHRDAVGLGAPHLK